MPPNLVCAFNACPGFAGGIETDKRVNPTLDGLAAGRDEVLEAALEMLARR